MNLIVIARPYIMFVCLSAGKIMSSKWTTSVKTKLKAKGITHQEVADRLNITRGAVSHYLNGIREPSINQVKEIAKMLDESLSELLGDDATFITGDNPLRMQDLLKGLPEDKQLLAIKLVESLYDDNPE